jgi:hypothetical protein
LTKKARYCCNSNPGRGHRKETARAHTGFNVLDDVASRPNAQGSTPPSSPLDGILMAREAFFLD